MEQIKFLQSRGHFETEQDLEDNKIKLNNYLQEFNLDSNYALLLIDMKIEDYNRNLNRALLDITSDIFNRQSLEKKDPLSPYTEHQLNLDQVYLYRQLGNFLGYLGNCTSFRQVNEVIHGFDKIELISRLEKIILIIKNSK